MGGIWISQKADTVQIHTILTQKENQFLSESIGDSMEESLSIDQECIFHHEAVIRLYISKLRASLGKE